MQLMNGYDAARHICKNEDQLFDKHIPIIALTANPMKGDDSEYLKTGMNDYLAKPMLAQQLTEMLNKWVFLDKRKET